jgi:AraC-like DNA-binding protein
MRYRERAVTGRARLFIERYWILETDGRDPQIQRIVPDGRPELIVNLENPFESLSRGEWRVQPQAFVVGQLTGPLLVRPKGRAKILGMRLRPHAPALVLGAPIHELANRAVALDDFSLRVAGFESIERLLANTAKEPDALVGEAVRLASGIWDVEQLALRLGVSRRHLERRFREQVGIPPKLFCRLQRFQRVFRAVEDGIGWAQAALDCGYYDQAHLLRDFREFSGSAPAALLAGDELARHFLR